jgi:hypothetical protein
MDQRTTLAKILRTVADLIERNSPADIEDVISGRASLVISRDPEAKSARHGSRSSDDKKRRQPSGRDLGAVVAQLQELGSREAGFELLATMELTKRDLEAIARVMDLPVVREDDTEHLKQKIVEQSIGARLNSQAIRR